MAELITLFAETLSNGLMAVYDKGGNMGLLMLSLIGIFAILSSVIRDSGKTLGALFVVFIAAPFLFIEYLWKKYKENKK